MKNSKPIEWVGTSKNDLSAFPDEVLYDVGHALREAQDGGKSLAATPLKGYKGIGVLEIIDRFDKNTYRAVYTIKLKETIYVLHCFQKKSKTGIKTPKQDIKLINSRLKIAEEHYKINYKKE